MLFIHQQASDPPAERIELVIGPAAVLIDEREPIRIPALQQFRRRIQPLGIVELGQVETKLRKQLRRRQALANERIVGHLAPSRNGEVAARKADGGGPGTCTPLPPPYALR